MLCCAAENLNHRVVAALLFDEGEVYILGHGRYVGNAFPPNHFKVCGVSLAEHGALIPKIQLDDGSTVWGFECCIVDESLFHTAVGDRVVVHVDVADVRAGRSRFSEHWAQCGRQEETEDRQVA